MLRNADDLLPYKNFNKALKEFFRELPVMLPHCPEAKKPILYYKMLKTLNKRQPQKRFQQILGPYTAYILQKDDSVFMSSSFQNEDVGGDIIVTARTEWQRMSQEQKERVWTALNQLVQLSYICEVQRQESRKKLF